MASHGELRFIPLGGCGEIGMNTSLYGLDGTWMMVDLGLSFADDTLPGIDLVLPDLRALKTLGAPIEALVVTHAHEDHIGAVAHLWPRLNCPIYCTAFTAAVLRRKFEEQPRATAVSIRVVEPMQEFRIGPFSCKLIHVSHSIPAAGALAITTHAGNVLHTGDWKLDPAPLLGAKTDSESLAAFGKTGVRALICDSTNVLSPGTSGSEAEVRESLTALVAEQKNRVLLTTFASNLARLSTAMYAARKAGREIAVVGRSMRKMIEAAREVGYLADMPMVLDERQAMQMPRNKIFILCTGSQGEARAALSRIANRQHPTVRLDPDDTVIFSSKIIPGNERTLYNLHNGLVRQGVEVITEDDHFVHVSGHPCRDEIEQMYRWIKPEVAIPVHGEARHLHAHVAFAKELGVPEALLVQNGDVVRLAPGEAAIVDRMQTGRMALDNGRLLEIGDEMFRTRRQLNSHGTIVVALVLDPFGSVLAQPQVTLLGAMQLDEMATIKESLNDAVMSAVEALDDDDAEEDEKVRGAVRVAVRQSLNLPRDRRPMIEVQVMRLSAAVLDALEADEEVKAR